MGCREGKENWRAASFTILASYLHSFDFMKLETRFTTQPASQLASQLADLAPRWSCIPWLDTATWKLMKCILTPHSRHPAEGTWSCAPDYFLVYGYDNREDQRISQTHRTATHDAPSSFLLILCDDVHDSAVQSRYLKLKSCLCWLFVYLKVRDFLCETELI